MASLATLTAAMNFPRNALLATRYSTGGAGVGADTEEAARISPTAGRAVVLVLLGVGLLVISGAAVAAQNVKD